VNETKFKFCDRFLHVFPLHMKTWLFVLGVYVLGSMFELEMKQVLIIITQTSNTNLCLLQKNWKSMGNHDLESLQVVAKNPRVWKINK